MYQPAQNKEDRNISRNNMYKTFTSGLQLMWKFHGLFNALLHSYLIMQNAGST